MARPPYPSLIECARCRHRVMADPGHALCRFCEGYGYGCRDCEMEREGTDDPAWTGR